MVLYIHKNHMAYWGQVCRLSAPCNKATVHLLRVCALSARLTLGLEQSFIFQF